jgi:hypothetical protein
MKDLQAKILKLAKQHEACGSEFTRAKEATTEKELLQVVKENFSWCYSRKVITPEILDEFTPDLLIEFGIYHKGVYPKIENLKGLIFCGSVKVEMLDSSQVGEMLDSSQVGEMFDSSQVGKMLGSSQVGKMWGSSQVGKMWGSSQVGKMLDSSQVGEMWGSSQVGEMWDSSQVGKMLGSSQVGEMWDSSQVGKMLDSSIARIYGASVKMPKETGDNFCIVNLVTKEIFCGEGFKVTQKETVCL